jgi:DNA-binding response OmpR family regulator
MQGLIVDDNRQMRMLAREALRAMGIESDVCADARSAIAALSAGRFDICLVDLAMPQHSGLDLIRWIRTSRNAPQPTMPLLVVSAHATPARIAEAIAAGADAFLAKPITISALHSKVRRLLREAA